MRHDMNRRDFLRRGAAAAAVLAPWSAARAQTAPANIVVLVELQGGNDGLNTLIPFADPRYAQLRPRLAIARDQVIQVSEQLGLNPALRGLMPIWEARELAVVAGVGYPEPNLSHFRSIEIWDTASDSRTVLREGWGARALGRMEDLRDPATAAIVLGRPHAGPMSAYVQTVVMENPGAFAEQARTMAASEASGQGAMGHILATQRALRRSGGEVHAALQRTPAPAMRFPATGLGGQLANATRLVASGLDVRVIKTSLGSFDTHVNQRPTHDNLLTQLADALAAFREAMQAAGTWERVTVVTYSEFGRRPAENSGLGTDHGTAGPLFVMGGRVRGGHYGEQPPLGELVNDNLRFRVDFRSVYATVLKRVWSIEPNAVIGRDVPLVEFMA
jgi:uncharacterized protein (DUF1501 family)